MWVPIDDENCWAWSINFHPDKPLSAHERAEMAAGKGIHVVYEDVHPMTFRPRANDNDYFVDRAAQKDKRSYSGVFGFSSRTRPCRKHGQRWDHTKEMLLPTTAPS